MSKRTFPVYLVEYLEEEPFVRFREFQAEEVRDTGVWVMDHGNRRFIKSGRNRVFHVDRASAVEDARMLTERELSGRVREMLERIDRIRGGDVFEVVPATKDPVGVA